MKCHRRVAHRKLMHTRLIVLLAQAGAQQLPPELGNVPVHRPVFTPEMKLILGLAMAVALALFVWAFFIRKRRPADPRMKAIEPGPITEAEPEEESHHRHHRHGRHHRRHKKHRSQTRHRHRNPTLAETGGLPPVRPEGELPKY